MSILSDRMDKVQAKFYKRGRVRSGGRFWNPFGYTQVTALADPEIKKPGKQNKRRGTILKHKRKVAHESRRRNRVR